MFTLTTTIPGMETTTRTYTSRPSAVRGAERAEKRLNEAGEAAAFTVTEDATGAVVWTSTPLAEPVAELEPEPAPKPVAAPARKPRRKPADIGPGSITGPLPVPAHTPAPAAAPARVGGYPVKSSKEFTLTTTWGETEVMVRGEKTDDPLVLRVVATGPVGGQVLGTIAWNNAGGLWRPTASTGTVGKQIKGKDRAVRLLLDLRGGPGQA